MISKLLTFLAILLLPAAIFAQSAPVTVFAAASLRGALDEVAATYDAKTSLSFGGSGTIARQVAAGAPADLVVLASPDWMDWLHARSLISDEARVDFLTNSLVVIAPANSTINPDPANLAASLGGARLAMGQRDAVPAGIYAREWLEVTGQWAALMPMFAETDNVRAALALVAAGEMPLGIVYRTDAMAEPDVRVVYAVPDDQHSRITYPAAPLTPAGAAFLNHLQSPESLKIFARHGFGPVTP